MKINGYNRNIINEEYKLKSANYKGRSVPKSFWQKISSKKAIPMILAIAIAGGIYIQSVKQPDIKLNQTAIVQELGENVSNYEELYKLIEEYNSSDSFKNKSEIMVKLSEHSKFVEDMILHKTKSVFCNALNNAENSKEKYNSDDIRIDISFDKGEGKMIYGISKNGINDNLINTNYHSKTFDKCMNAIYQLQDREYKHYGDQGLDVINALNCINELNNSNFTSKYNEKKDKYEFKEQKKQEKVKNNDIDIER